MNPKNFATILHSQFNYHTLPVTPFKHVSLKAIFLKCFIYCLHILGTLPSVDNMNRTG